jgi:hypothetical protein
MVAVFTSKEDMQLISGVATSSGIPPRSSTTSTSMNNNGKSKLPHNFLPSPHAVICGRGKACSSSPGNKSLRRIINSYLTPYSEARNKLEKSAIVSSIVGSIKQAAPNGAFVKFEQGCWWEVEDGVAREKVGCLLRDSLHTQYRSSTKAKLARRRAKNKLMADGIGGADELSSSNHSSYGYSISINSNHSSINSSYNSSYSSADLNNSNSSLFSLDVVEEIVEPVAAAILSSSSGGMNMHHNHKSAEQQEPSSSYLPMIQDFYACSLQQQQQQQIQSPVVRSNTFHMFRDVMPTMNSYQHQHLDITGGGSCGGARKGDHDISSFNMLMVEEEQQCHSRSLPRALQQACDLLASFEDDVDLPDDISDIFD